MPVVVSLQCFVPYISHLVTTGQPNLTCASSQTMLQIWSYIRVKCSLSAGFTPFGQHHDTSDSDASMPSLTLFFQTLLAGVARFRNIFPTPSSLPNTSDTCQYHTRKPRPNRLCDRVCVPLACDELATSRKLLSGALTH